MQKIYENIRRLRIEKGMSQSELAKLTGYTDRSSIAKIEKGQVDLTQSKIKAFADVLGISPTELMGITDVQENEQPYYYNDDARELANFMAENPEYKGLFDAVRTVSKSDIEFVKDFIDRIKRN